MASGGAVGRAWVYFGVALACLVVLPWDYKTIPGPMLHNTTKTPADEPQDTAGHSRQVLYFPCADAKCQAWLYLPKKWNGDKPPIVIAAHGLGSQKDFGLGSYGERFARAGFASFIFDYRTFGGSEGQPRHWVSPKRHLQDYESAVEYVKSELADIVDVDRINLWGTSFSGGHVLTLAGSSLRDNVTSVIAQVPFVDGRETLKRNVRERGVVMVVRALLAGIHDALRELANYPPAYFPLISEPGGYSFMGLTHAESHAYYAKHPPQRQGGWRNMVRCMLSLEGSRYRPITYVAKIKAPVLYIAANHDSLCPLPSVQAAATATQDARFISVNCNHFEVYSGQPFAYLVQQMVAFLREKNGLPALHFSAADAARHGHDAAHNSGAAPGIKGMEEALKAEAAHFAKQTE